MQQFFLGNGSLATNSGEPGVRADQDEKEDHDREGDVHRNLPHADILFKKPKVRVSSSLEVGEEKASLAEEETAGGLTPW